MQSSYSWNSQVHIKEFGIPQTLSLQSRPLTNVVNMNEVISSERKETFESRLTHLATPTTFHSSGFWLSILVPCRAGLIMITPWCLSCYRILMHMHRIPRGELMNEFKTLCSPSAKAQRLPEKFPDQVKLLLGALCCSSVSCLSCPVGFLCLTIQIQLNSTLSWRCLPEEDMQLWSNHQIISVCGS